MTLLFVRVHPLASYLTLWDLGATARPRPQRIFASLLGGLPNLDPAPGRFHPLCPEVRSILRSPRTGAEARGESTKERESVMTSVPVM